MKPLHFLNYADGLDFSVFVDFKWKVDNFTTFFITVKVV